MAAYSPPLIRRAKTEDDDDEVKAGEGEREEGNGWKEAMRLGDVRSASLPSSIGREDDGARHDTDDSKKVIYDVFSGYSLS